MIQLSWTNRFEKKLNNWLMKHPETKELINRKLELFVKNPLAPELNNHKLSGRLKTLRAITISYDCRIVFSLENNKALLTSIGTHDEVY